MINKEDIAGYLLAVNRFMTKRGSDMESRLALNEAITTLAGDDLLDGIYVNEQVHALLPDVAVIHLYNDKFDKFLLDPDCDETCPFGFTLEINARCFDLYTEEQLGAAILHDILQNVLSDTAKVRFLKAYTDAIEGKTVQIIDEMFEDVKVSEVLYIAFTEICLRPFKVPVGDGGSDQVAVDSVLSTYGLGDAYDSYLTKFLPMSNDTIDDRINQEIKDDARDVSTIIACCMDHAIHHYYAQIRDQVPLITLQKIFDCKKPMLATGFISRCHNPKRKKNRDDKEHCEPILESFADPKNDYELRFSVDKIINSLRYAESEGERDVILFKIKNLALKIERQKAGLMKKASDAKTSAKIQRLQEYLDELEELRKRCVNMEIKKKHWSVYIKDELPEGYDF